MLQVNKLIRGVIWSKYKKKLKYLAKFGISLLSQYSQKMLYRICLKPKFNVRNVHQSKGWKMMQMALLTDLTKKTFSSDYLISKFLWCLLSSNSCFQVYSFTMTIRTPGNELGRYDNLFLELRAMNLRSSWCRILFDSVVPLVSYFCIDPFLVPLPCTISKAFWIF